LGEGEARIEPFVFGQFPPFIDKRASKREEAAKDLEKKKDISIEDFFMRFKPASYVPSSEVSDEFLEKLVNDGFVLFPDGSFISDGSFTLGGLQKINDLLKIRFSKVLLETLISVGGKEAVKRMIKEENGALLLCVFSIQPDF